VLLHASPAEPGLRPARPDGTPIAAYAERGEPIANQQRFSWGALNVTNATTCGGDKCYFQGEREGEGWLVGGRSYLIQQSRGWAFAEELRVDFGVDHLLRGAPFLSTLPYKQAKYLNARLNTSSLHKQKRPLWRVSGMKRKDGAKQYYLAGPHPVQAVRSCSWPECMVLKCPDNLIRRLGPDNLLTAQAIEGFVASAPNETKLFLGLQRNFALVTAMIKAHPCLKSDFQVYLRNDGAVLNIDLDRCKRNKSGSVIAISERLANKTMTLTTRPLRLTCGTWAERYPQQQQKKQQMQQIQQQQMQMQQQQQAEGQQAEGQQAKGQQAERQQAEGQQAEGQQAKGQQAERQILPSSYGYAACGQSQWPLQAADILHQRNGPPVCLPTVENASWTLHQSSLKRPSKQYVDMVLRSLPVGTSYKWHSDSDVCRFMRTQPLRFQALFNFLPRTVHKIDLWRYLLLHEQGGIYLDDDAKFNVVLNASLLDKVDSAYVMPTFSATIGFVVYNGFLASRPCNRALLNTAERMVDLGYPVLNHRSRYSAAALQLSKLRWGDNATSRFPKLNWYNLALLASAVAAQAPPTALNHCTSDNQAGGKKPNCTFFRRDHSLRTATMQPDLFAATRSLLPQRKNATLFEDRSGWRVALLDSSSVRQVHGAEARLLGMRDD